VPQFRQAIANGDADGAYKIAGHFAVDLAAAAMGGQHSVVGEGAKPIFPGMDEAVKDYAATGMRQLGVGPEWAKNAISEAVGKAKQAAKDKIAATQTGPEGLAAIQRAFPASASAPYDPNDAQIAYNALAEHHATVEDIRTPEDVRDALDMSIKDNEAKVKAAIAEIPDEPVRVNVMDRVKAALGDHPRGDFVSKGLKELEDYDLDKPSVTEADRIRRVMNAENNAVLKKNNYAIDDARATDPGFVAREAAANALRDGVYNTLEAYGKDQGVTARELRQDEGSLISFRNAVMQKLFNGEQVVRGTGSTGLGRGIAREVIKYGTAAAGGGLGTAVPIPGAAVAGALTGRGVGGYLANRLLPVEDMSRNDLIESAFTKKARGADVTETPSERQIRGQIRQPAEAAPKGQQEVPFGPPALFGQEQGALTSTEKFASWYRDNYPETNIPPERTTGEFDDAIKAGGAVPGGIQKSGMEDYPDFAYFHDPITGSSLALPTNEPITPERVQAKIQESRNTYLAKPTPKTRAAAEPDIEILSHKGESNINASGESAASKEAINRINSEKHAGIIRMREDTRSGKRLPLPTVDAVDAKAGPYDRIIKVYPDGYEEVLDQGEKAK